MSKKTKTAENILNRKVCTANTPATSSPAIQFLRAEMQKLVWIWDRKSSSTAIGIIIASRFVAGIFVADLFIARRSAAIVLALQFSKAEAIYMSGKAKTSLNM